MRRTVLQLCVVAFISIFCTLPAADTGDTWKSNMDAGYSAYNDGNLVEAEARVIAALKIAEEI